MREINVKFLLNKSLDKKIVFEFLGFRAGGVNFSDGIFGVHPDMKKRLLDYIDSFYKKKNEILKKTVYDFKKEWDLTAPVFLKAIDNFFGDCNWPQGKYVGFVSIFNCNPRFLENKTFQIFFKHKNGPVVVTAHELSHFVFYDYIFKNKINLKYKLSDDELWQISEIVNEVIFSLPMFRKIFTGYMNTEEYPAFKDIVMNIKKKGITGIDNLVDNILKFRQLFKNNI